MLFLRRMGSPLLFLVIALLCTGCATTTAGKRTAAGLQLDFQSKADEGFVVIKVVSVRPISLLNPKWQSINVVSNGKPQSLHDVTADYNMLMGKHVPTESLYFAKLPVGVYSVSSLGSIGPGPGLIPALIGSDRSMATGKLPQFSVKAKGLANLGTLVYVPEIEDEAPARVLLLHGDAGKASARQDLLAEARLAELPLAQEGGWIAPPQLDEAALLSEARGLVSMLTIRANSHPAADFSAGSHLGQIFHRAGAQKWRRENLDTLTTLYATAELPGGIRIAGGSYGEYFVKRPGANWQPYRLPNELGRIVHIEPRPDSSVLFMTGDLRQTRMVLKKSLEDASEAVVSTVVAEEPPDNLLIQSAEIIFATSTPGKFRESTITRINKSSLNIQSQAEKFWVMQWQQLDGGKVMLARMNGMSAYLSSSADNGRTWAHGNNTGVAGLWIDTSSGYSMEPSFGFRLVTNHFRKTVDGGKTWQRLGSPLTTIHYAGRIVYAGADEVIVQGSNMLFSSIDQGASWQRILPAAAKK
jgi:hypothetical protein